jgi:hypothetical protein
MKNSDNRKYVKARARSRHQLEAQRNLSECSTEKAVVRAHAYISTIYAGYPIQQLI